MTIERSIDGTNKNATPLAAALARWAVQHPTIQSQLPVKFAGHGKTEISELQYKCTVCDKHVPDTLFCGVVETTDGGHTWDVYGLGACEDCYNGNWCAWHIRYDPIAKEFIMDDARETYPMPVNHDGTAKRAIAL